MNEGIIVPFIVFGTGALIVFLVMYFNGKNRAAVQKTIRLALDKGHELSPELLDRLTAPKQVKASDLRRGLISVAVGVGFALFGFILDEEDAVRPMIGIGMFPFIVGLAYLALWRFGDREQQS